MMMMMAEAAEQKRRAGGFFSCEVGAPTTGSRSFGTEGNKRIKGDCRRGGGSAAAAGGAYVSIKDKKDKIGERVAALQQLVSPFGKTDTASVLQEATSYIKFLHEQLQVLSAPYIQSTPRGTLQHAQGTENSLRSRGLCLMPVECTQNVARSNGADIWAPVSMNRV